MIKKNNTIIAECPLFVCRECHTKTEYPHQKWCTLSDAGKTECECCLYWQESRKRCAHPYKKKDGIAK